MHLRVNRCCCMSLRVGGLVLGWLGIVSSVLGILYMFLILIINPTIFDDINKNIQNAIKISMARSIVMNTLNAIISGLLVHGINKNKHKLLLPWLIVQAIIIIIASVVGLGAWIVGLYVAFTEAENLGLALIGLVILSCILILAIGFAAWCWIVVLSLYDEIRNEENKPLPSEMQLPHLENGIIEPAPLYQKFNN